MIGDDAADKVGLCVVKCGHQFSERLFVELADSTEHSFLCLGGAWHGAV